MRQRSVFRTFRELMGEIAYSWSYPYEFSQDRDKNGQVLGYYLNKLYIAPTEVTYKLEVWDISPELYASVEKFYELLQS